MATLERGKGKRKQVIEIVRHGRVLRMRETEAGDQRLPGYRVCASEAAAIAALAAEVRSHLDAGMQPVDDEARAIAASQPARKAGTPVLPVRQDLDIYNEATGFVVTSRKMAGKTMDEGSPEWEKAVSKGEMLPLTLVQDDPFIIRVVAGGPLTAQEEEEWLARVDWHLNVPDGKLCITGGAVFTNDDYDTGDPQSEDYVGEVPIPKGRYRAALYTHIHVVNGGSVLDHLAGGYEKGESLESWFARTRPGEAPSNAEEHVGFLLHLEPIATAPKTGLSVLPAEGWFTGLENARRPERCPLGLAAVDVVRTSRGEAPGKWTFVRDVFELMPSLDRRIVKGDPVALPLDALTRAVRIAWFGSRFTTTELRLSPPSGASLDLDAEWPEGAIAVEEGGVGRILFDADLDINEILVRLPALTARLAALPDGTVLDVCCAPLESMSETSSGAGLVALRGPIRGGAWRIAQAHPGAEADTLTAALSLAAEIEHGTSIAVHDDEEGNAILMWAKRAFGVHLKRNPPKLSDGAIRFETAGREVALLGIAAFAHRFAKTWPVVDLTKDAPPEADDDESDGLFPTTPIKGAEVFSAESGRVYHATMAMLVSERVGAEIPKRERPLFGAGFKHVGDVVCSASEHVGLRGYARPGGNAWAYFRISAPLSIDFEIASTFVERDAVLVTNGNAGERDDAASNVFRQGSPGAGVKDLTALHEQRLAELTATLGPVRAVAGLRSFAETLEAVRRKA